MDYLKIGKATELKGGDYIFYRLLEIFSGAAAWGTLLILIIFSYFQPIWVAYFIIAFDVYWLLLVVYLAIMLFTSYFKMKEMRNMDWRKKCEELTAENAGKLPADALIRNGFTYQDIVHLVISPTYTERWKFCAPASSPSLIPVFLWIRWFLFSDWRARRAGRLDKAAILKNEYDGKFRNFVVTVHPDGIVGELKARAPTKLGLLNASKEEIIDKEKIPYNKILTSVFDSDTVVYPGFFHCLTYYF